MATIKIEEVSGQSFYKDIVFEGNYFQTIDKILVKHISECFKHMTAEFFNEIYVDCKNEQLKTDIISEIVKANPKMKIVVKPNRVGCNFGFNVYVWLNNPSEEEYQKKKIELNERKNLQKTRNRLNRKISTLKKVELKKAG